MKEILTAEEFCEITNRGNLSGGWEDTDQYNEVKNLMIEFAKLHVQAALQSAFEKLHSDALETYCVDIPDCWDDQSILTAYPLENIK